VNDAQVTVVYFMPAMPAMNMPEMKTSIACRQGYLSGRRLTGDGRDLDRHSDGNTGGQATWDPQAFGYRKIVSQAGRCAAVGDAGGTAPPHARCG
jgi:hypothetical protein